jgi:hypothetical protein
MGAEIKPYSRSSLGLLGEGLHMGGEILSGVKYVARLIGHDALLLATGKGSQIEQSPQSEIGQ